MRGPELLALWLRAWRWLHPARRRWMLLRVWWVLAPPIRLLVHTSPSLAQAGFRARNDDGSQTAATWKAAENTGWTQPVDENFRIRFVVDETAGGGENNTDLQLQYNLNGAGWNNVTGSSLVVRAAASGGLTENEATTRQLTSGTGTFLAGTVDEVDGLCDNNFSPTGGELTEVEYCVQVRSADVANNDQLQLRVIRSSGTVLENYAQTPTVTVSESTATNYDETGKLITVTSTTTVTDTAALTDTGRHTSVATTVGETDTAGFADTPETIVITATVGVTDTLGSGGTAYDDTGRHVTITATIGADDQVAAIEVLGLEATATTAGSDRAGYQDTAETTVTAAAAVESDTAGFVEAPDITVVATVTITDTYSGSGGTGYDDTGRHIDLVADTGLVDTLTASEAPTASADVIIDLVDTLAAVDSLQVTAVITLTATDTGPGGYVGRVESDDRGVKVAIFSQGTITSRVEGG